MDKCQGDLSHQYSDLLLIRFHLRSARKHLARTARPHRMFMTVLTRTSDQ